MNIPLGQWSGSNATERLRETILEIDEAAKKKTDLIIILTIISIVVSAIGVVIALIK